MMKRIKKVLVVYKRPLLFALPKRYRDGRHPLTARSRLAEREHRRTLASVRRVLKRAGVVSSFRSRLTLGAIRKFDLILTVGGDGTLLKTSHRISNQPVLGINSSPSTSVGALCGITGNEIEKKLPAILSGRYHVKKLNRLQIGVNGKNLPVLALNDVLFANVSPGATSRYLIGVSGRTEEQRSSGVWVSTAAGSTAAIFTAGGDRLPLSSRKIQYLVREPYRSGQRRYRLIRGLLSSATTVQFVNKMNQASLFVDGMQDVFPVGYGDRIRVGSAQQPFYLVLSG